ncbi:hypothetical protein ACFSTI_08180 [Rhizorhabdus histidinilytica]
MNLRSATTPAARGQVYNAASGIRVTINDLATNMLKFTSRNDIKVEHGPPLVGDIMNFDIDNIKVRTDLDIEFNLDFWGTLQSSLSDIDGFLELN